LSLKWTPWAFAACFILIGCGKDGAKSEALPREATRASEPATGGQEPVERALGGAGLIAVAIDSYKNYVEKSHEADVKAMVGEIRRKQIVFFSTYSVYESSTLDETVFTGVPYRDGEKTRYRWDVDCAKERDQAWCRLGFKPMNPSKLYAQLQTLGWSPRTKDNPPSIVKNPDERWLIVRARYQGPKGCTTIGWYSEHKKPMKMTRTPGPCP
jgi:hypothetical protein